MERSFKRYLNISIIWSLMFALIGLFLIFKPLLANTIISYVVAIFFITDGIISLYSYYTSPRVIRNISYGLIYGILFILLGIILIIQPNILIGVFPITLGLWIIVNSVIKFEYSLTLKEERKYCIMTMIVAILTFLLGITLLFNPFKSAFAITQIIGIFVTLYAVLDLFDKIIFKRNIKKIIKAFK